MALLIKIFISVFSFNFLWIFVDVYQMSTIANVDKQVALLRIPCPRVGHYAQYCGLTIGIKLGLQRCIYTGSSAGLHFDLCLYLYAFRKTIPLWPK